MEGSMEPDWTRKKRYSEKSGRWKAEPKTKIKISKASKKVKILTKLIALYQAEIKVKLDAVGLDLIAVIGVVGAPVDGKGFAFARV